MLYELFVKGVIVLLLLNMVLPPILYVISWLVSHITRKDYEPTLCSDYQSLKWGNPHNEIDYFIFDLLVGTLLVGVISIFVKAFGLEATGCVLIWGTLLIISVLYIPRWVYDICKGLKYKSKTGKLERIEALEREVERLKQEK